MSLGTHKEIAKNGNAALTRLAYTFDKTTVHVSLASDLESNFYLISSSLILPVSSVSVVTIEMSNFMGLAKN